MIWLILKYLLWIVLGAAGLAALLAAVAFIGLLYAYATDHH
jgi:hypothetical protein